MTSTPYYDSSTNVALSTLGSNPRIFQYVPNAESTQFYPNHEVHATLGPMNTPQIYAKDLDILEIASSGQVVMSLQDQTSLAFSNRTESFQAITSLQGSTNNAIHFTPTNASRTLRTGHLITTNGASSTLDISTLETQGIQLRNQTRLQSTLEVSDRANLHHITDIRGSTTLWSTLNVPSQAVFKGPLSTTRTSLLQNVVSMESSLTTQGLASVENDATISSNTWLRRTLDVCGNAVLHSTLSVLGNIYARDVTARDVNVSSITSTGSFRVSNQAILLDGLDVIGNVRLYSTLRTQSATTFRSTLTVVGASRIESTLSVASTSTLCSTLTVQDQVQIDGPLRVDSNLRIQGSSIVHAPVDVLGTLTLKNSLSLSQALDVQASSWMGSTLSVLGTAHFIGPMNAVNPVRLYDDLRVQGWLSVGNQSVFDASLHTFQNVYVFQRSRGEFMNTKYVWFNNDGRYMVASREYNYINQWSMTLWVKVVSSVTNQAIVVDSRVQGVTSFGAFLFVLDDRNVDDYWHFYAVIMNGTNLRIYQDDNQTPIRTIARNDAESESVGSCTLYKPTFGMTSIYNGTYVSNMSFDEIAVYPYALLTSQINEVYNAGIPQDVRSLASMSISGSTLPSSYYRFETLLPNNHVPDLMDATRSLQSYVAGSSTPTSTLLASHLASSISRGAGTDTLYNDGKIASNTYLSNTFRLKGSVDTIDGSLNVVSIATVRSNLLVSGSTSLSNSFSMNSTLDILGHLQNRKDLQVVGSSTYSGTVNTSDQSMFRSTLEVRDKLASLGGSTRIGNTMSLMSNAHLMHTLDVNGDATRLRSTLLVQDASIFSSTLKVQDCLKAMNYVSLGSSLNGRSSVVLSSSLSTLGSVSLQNIFDVCGSTVVQNQLQVYGNAHALSNLRLGDGVSIQAESDLTGPVTLRSTLLVQTTTSFSSDLKTGVVRPSTSAVTIDASRVVIRGDIDLVGTINTVDSLQQLAIQDKQIALAYDPSGEKFVDGTSVNHQAGVFIHGFPSGLSQDPNGLYQKSFSWEFDTVQSNASWSSLGKTASTNSQKPSEPTWMLRGGSFKIANYRDVSNGAVITMRINAEQELEVWRSRLVKNMWDHVRITRFGRAEPLASLSSITAFSASLGSTTRGTTSLSLTITSVTDTLFSSKGIQPYYSATNVKIVTEAGVEYPAPSVDLFFVSTSGLALNFAPVTVLNLPSDTLFTSVRATIMNQFGVQAPLQASVFMSTYDLTGPVIVGSLTVSSGETSINVQISSYDVGISTTTYTGVLFVSLQSTLTQSYIDTITGSTPNTYAYTGTNKTSASPDTFSTTLTVDISGSSITTNSYYLYAVLFDPVGNRTSNRTSPSGPHAVTGPYVNSKSIYMAGSSVLQYAENTTWAPSVTNGVSVSFWVYTKTGNATEHWYYTLGNGATGTGWLAGSATTAAQPKLYANSTSSFTHNPSPSHLDTWHFLTFVYINNGASTNATIKIYADGGITHAVTGTSTTPLSTLTQRLSVGRKHLSPTGYSNEFLFGNVDEMAIWETVLTDAQVTELYNYGVPKNVLTHSAAASLQSYWKFEEFTNSTQIFDHSGKGHPLNVVNAPVLQTSTKKMRAVPTLFTNPANYTITNASNGSSVALSPSGDYLFAVFAHTTDQKSVLLRAYETQSGSYSVVAETPYTYTPLAWIGTIGTAVCIEAYTNTKIVLASTIHNNTYCSLLRFTFTGSAFVFDSYTQANLGATMVGQQLQVLRIGASGEHMISNVVERDGDNDTIRIIRYNGNGAAIDASPLSYTTPRRNNALWYRCHRTAWVPTTGYGFIIPIKQYANSSVCNLSYYYVTQSTSQYITASPLIGSATPHQIGMIGGDRIVVDNFEGSYVINGSTGAVSASSWTNTANNYVWPTKNNFVFDQVSLTHNVAPYGTGGILNGRRGYIYLTNSTGGIIETTNLPNYSASIYGYSDMYQVGTNKYLLITFSNTGPHQFINITIS